MSGLAAFFAPLAAMDNSGIDPRNSGDVSRAATRRNRPPLPMGRPVLPVTSENRERLLQHFCHWLEAIGVSHHDVFHEPRGRLQLINDLLAVQPLC